ncbi:type II secretion system protein [Clostridium beijerinckii]|uniref:type II secretion system protein n=1 Tax=Clostridium beijerinckii TaxID=1520 RepID=UPI000478C86A|nr:type II secretion system protein [Clostridium beijerinckii]
MSKKSLCKKRKREAFTLIEMIAVIAIIGILAVAILPKVNGYINEAKKVKVVDQSRKIIMAVESYNLKSDSPLSENTIVSSAVNNKGISKYLDGVELSNLNTSSTSLKNCYDIVNGAEFDFLEDTDVLNPLTISKGSSKDDVKK